MKSQKKKVFSKIGWTPEVKAIKTQQEEQLCKLVKQLGKKKWDKISKRLKQRFPEIQRCGKQCRERYMNYLEPFCRNQEIPDWEISSFDQLFRLYLFYGTRWSKVAQEMQYWQQLRRIRSENFIKNKFNGSMRKVLRKIRRLKNEGPKDNNRLKFKTLISIMRFPEGGTDHSTQLINKTNRIKEKILQQALQIEKGNDNIETMDQISKGINDFTTKNKGYLMTLGKKRLKAKMHQLSESSEDQGFHNIVILERRQRVQGNGNQIPLDQIAKSSKKEGTEVKTNQKLDARQRVTAVFVPWPIVKLEQSQI